MESAQETIDLFRGAINYFLNPDVKTPSFFSHPKALNTIVAGPLIFIKKVVDNGERIPFWVEDIFYARKALAVGRREIEKVRNVSVKLISEMNDSEMSGVFREGLLRYTRALDSYDRELSFIRLWNAIEYLTFLSVGEKYSTTIRRAIFHYEDHTVAEQVMKHLAETRNGIVHRKSKPGENHIEIFQLARMVRNLLSLYLSKHIRKLSVQDVKFILDSGTLLDSARKMEDDLKRKTKVLGQFLRATKKEGQKIQKEAAKQ